MKRFEIMIRFESEDYPAAIKRVAKLLRENPDIMGTGIQGAEPLTFEQGGENFEVANVQNNPNSIAVACQEIA